MGMRMAMRNTMENTLGSNQNTQPSGTPPLQAQVIYYFAIDRAQVGSFNIEAVKTPKHKSAVIK